MRHWCNLTDSFFVYTYSFLWHSYKCRLVRNKHFRLHIRQHLGTFDHRCQVCSQLGKRTDTIHAYSRISQRIGCMTCELRIHPDLHMYDCLGPNGNQFRRHICKNPSSLYCGKCSLINFMVFGFFSNTVFYHLCEHNPGVSWHSSMSTQSLSSWPGCFLNPSLHSHRYDPIVLMHSELLEQICPL